MFAVGTCISPSFKQNFHSQNPCAITYVALAALTLSALGAALITQGGSPITGGVLIGLGALEALVDLVFYNTTKKPNPPTPAQPSSPKPPPLPSQPKRILVTPTDGGMDMSMMVVGGTDADESPRGGSKISKVFGSIKSRVGSR